MPTPLTEPEISAETSPASTAQGGADDLGALVARSVDASAYVGDPTVACLLDDIHRRHGSSVAAVLMYGSYLRGKRDTLLDFYVLLENFQGALPRAWHQLANRLLPPNVYYQCVPGDDGEARSKYATLTVRQFERAMKGDFHSYFWSRFTQPCALIFSRDAQSERRVLDALQNATITFIEAVLPVLAERFSSRELWQTGFGLTYRAELRAEGKDRIAELFETNAQHFDSLCNAYARLPHSRVDLTDEGVFRQRDFSPKRNAILTWAVRTWLGKLLSALRIIKAAGTFDDPLDYLLWKIRRHSGIYIEPTDRQRRYPLLFAWPLLWRLYRLGAFR